MNTEDIIARILVSLAGLGGLAGICGLVLLLSQQWVEARHARRVREFMTLMFGAPQLNSDVAFPNAVAFPNDAVWWLPGGYSVYINTLGGEKNSRILHIAFRFPFEGYRTPPAGVMVGVTSPYIKLRLHPWSDPTKQLQQLIIKHIN